MNLNKRLALNALGLKWRLIIPSTIVAIVSIIVVQTWTLSLSSHALERRMDPASRPSLLDQVYRGRIAGILRQAGIVNTVDMRGGSRVILPGTQP